MTTTEMIIEKIKDKWHVKVICLVIAFFIYIFHQVSIVDSKVFSIPLKVNENGAVMCINELPPSVSVKIKTTTSNISKILNSDIKATVDLDNIYEAGTYKLPVNISVSNKLMEYSILEITMKPEVVEVKVDKKAVKYVPLVPNVVGEVAHGYKIAKIELDPSFLEVRGPEIALENLETIQTTSINVSNAKNSFSTEVDFFQLDKRYTINNKGKIKATVSIEALPYETSFNDIKVVSQNLQDNLQLDTKLGTVNLVLTGQMPVLEKYKLKDNFVYVDFSSIKEPGTYELPILTRKISDIQVSDISRKTVSVALSEVLVEEEVVTESLVESD